ncbi:hypothetical protein BIW11_03372 [Tropilaelaps mercedesae]|uniref:Uncharacterized protein n=1 Tax=Tropilaelaps mercedesae TaxID=418985 RepID=A0A1V9XMU4_9ACAR|nr:hypothetical protein BIW11_03372 [Tropilaelaps mercedesae]
MSPKLPVRETWGVRW